MPNLIAPDSYTDLIQRGNTFSVSVTGSALVERMANGVVVEKAAVASAAAYGPYASDMSFRVTCLSGVCTTSEAPYTDALGAVSSAGIFRRVSASTTAATGETVIVDATAGPVSVTLPASGGATVKKIDSSGNAITVIPPAGATIDGLTSVVIVGQFDAVSFARESTTSVVRV